MVTFDSSAVNEEVVVAPGAREPYVKAIFPEISIILMLLINTLPEFVHVKVY